jgi:hypothetical protein
MPLDGWDEVRFGGAPHGRRRNPRELSWPMTICLNVIVWPCIIHGLVDVALHGPCGFFERAQWLPLPVEMVYEAMNPWGTLGYFYAHNVGVCPCQGDAGKLEPRFYAHNVGVCPCQGSVGKWEPRYGSVGRSLSSLLWCSMRWSCLLRISTTNQTWGGSTGKTLPRTYATGPHLHLVPISSNNRTGLTTCALTQ